MVQLLFGNGQQHGHPGSRVVIGDLALPAPLVALSRGELTFQTAAVKGLGTNICFLDRQ